MASLIPSFLTSSSASTLNKDEVDDSSLIDVDKISLASSSINSTDEDESSNGSDLYMSVQEASPCGSCADDSFLSARSIITESQKGTDKLEEEKSWYRGTALFPMGPSWVTTRDDILRKREQRPVSGDEWDLFCLSDMVSSIREECRWRSSIAADPVLRKLMEKLDEPYSQDECCESGSFDALNDVRIRLKSAPSTTSVRIPSPAAGVDNVDIDRAAHVIPTEIAQRVLLNELSAVHPQDTVTGEWLKAAIEQSHMLLTPSTSTSSSSSCSSTTCSSTAVPLRPIKSLTESGAVDTVSRIVADHSHPHPLPMKDGWILTLHQSRTPRAILEAQHFRCADCGRFLDDEYAKKDKIRYCDYYGAIFCLCCCFSAKGVVPARILHNWNFREVPLSDRAAAFLEQTRTKPVFHIREVAPSLADKISSLKKVISIRARLRHAAMYIRYCSLADKTYINGMNLPTIFNSIPAHLIDEDDVFSIADLERVKSGELVTELESIFLLAQRHIENCKRTDEEPQPIDSRSMCDDRSFHCWLCLDERERLFPFQSDKAQRCDECGSLAHLKCFAKAQRENRGFKPECAKCKRIQAARIRRRFVSSCDND